MKLSQIYSNKPRVFLPIRFNGVTDDELSVVFARVKKPKDSEKDSHNLGKTLLIDLIDFLLLKDLNDVPGHFLVKHSILFADWVFYLEIQTPKGTFVTVKRSVKENTKIAFKAHPKQLKPGADNVEIPDSWDIPRLLLIGRRRCSTRCLASTPSSHSLTATVSAISSGPRPTITISSS